MYLAQIILKIRHALHSQKSTYVNHAVRRKYSIPLENILSLNNISSAGLVRTLIYRLSATGGTRDGSARIFHFELELGLTADRMTLTNGRQRPQSNLTEWPNPKIY